MPVMLVVAKTRWAGGKGSCTVQSALTVKLEFCENKLEHLTQTAQHEHPPLSLIRFLQAYAELHALSSVDVSADGMINITTT